MENSIEDKPNWTKTCCGYEWNLNHVVRCLNCGEKLRELRKFPKPSKKEVKATKKISETDPNKDLVDTNDTKATIDTDDTNEEKGGYVL